MTDRQQADLRGSVRGCRTEREYVYRDGHRVMVTQHEFSPEGNMLSQRHWNPDGSEWSIRCEYDTRGRIREKRFFRGENVPEVLSVYEYDALGRLERVMEHSAGQQRVSESFQYSPDGTKIQTCYPAPLSNEQRRTTSACGPAILHWSADTVAILKMFDSGGRALREVLYDADDRVIRRVAFAYDERGRLIQEGELIAGRIRDDFRHVYRYDASGRRIEADMRWTDLMGERRSYAHNPHGDCLEEIIEQNARLMDEPGPQCWTQRFRYRYDECPNWTERTTEVVRSNFEAEVTMIERRQLAYF